MIGKANLLFPFYEGILLTQQTWVGNSGFYWGRGCDCSNDGMSLKPRLGRDITDVLQSKGVSICGSSRCKTCVHMVMGNSFISNVSGRKYYVNRTQSDELDCGSMII